MSSLGTAHHSNAALVKLSGRIENYKCTRASASFVFTPTDRTAMGAVAVAAGAAGLGGQAVATASNASSLEEDADFVEFTLGGKSIQGWVWRSPFQEGDEVEVAAEVRGNEIEAFGVARPTDKTIALYPHCSRGRSRHYSNAVKWWLTISATLFILECLLLGWIGGSEVFVKASDNWLLLWNAIAYFAFFGAMVFCLSKRWLPFVGVAEKVFRTLGWPNPSMVDLKNRTKAQRTKNDPPECGVFYFRY